MIARLVLEPEAHTELVAHATEAYPHECCGLLLGERQAAGSLRARRAFRARNLVVERAHDRYELDPADRLAAERAAEAAGWTLVGFYHSHPEHDAYFSPTDLARSEEVQWGEPWLPPTYGYVVVSVRGGAVVDARAFLVEGGQSAALPLEVAAG